MAYYPCNIELNSAIVYDVNYSLTTTGTVHHLDLANHKELIILGDIDNSLSNIYYAKYALRYDLTDNSIFNKLISTICFYSSTGANTQVYVTLDITKTFLTAQIYNSAHNNFFRIFKIILI